MKSTSCGYGAVTDCDNADCFDSEHQAEWKNGFFEWVGEELLGCD